MPLQFALEIIHLTEALRMHIIGMSRDEARCEGKYVDSPGGELEAAIGNSDFFRRRQH